MGVLGLTPFLQKTCPAVIKQLPDRLRGLTGKTIVIYYTSDGTLITQRLHFAPVPHPYRHILGWYRIIQELKSCGVSAICVFDGKERSQAKAREAERRREVQRLAAARGSIEIERSKRLRQLVGLLNQFRELKGPERERVTGLLKQMASETGFLSTRHLPSWYRNGDVDPIKSVHQPVKSEDQLAVASVSDTSSDPLPPLEDVSLTREPFPLRDADVSASGTRSIPQGHVEESSNALLSDLGLQSAPPPTDTLPVSDPRIPLTSEWEPQEALGHTETSTSIGAPPLPELDSDLVIPREDDINATVEPSPKLIDAITTPASDLEVPLDDLYYLRPLAQADTDPASTSTPALPDAQQQQPSSHIQDQPFPSLQHEQIDLDLHQPSKASKSQLQLSDLSLGSSLTAIDDIPTTLASLYLDYRNSIPKLASLNSSSSPTPAFADTTDPDDRTEYVMTKSQYQLTLEEGRFWDELVASPKPDDSEVQTQAQSEHDSTTAANLISLVEKSNIMSESYQRRTNPPTMQTYDECREILHAMGVPCLESSGAFEAEALASSLVIHGLADYVASEDTDVLVYEAPLIRNITNRQGPLVIVSGADVRAGLQLSRSSFIDFALLLGTDFSQRIKNVGPTRALKFIREHKSIERVIEQETKYPPRLPTRVYLEQVAEARLVFETLPPVPSDVGSLRMRESDDVEVGLTLQRYGLGRAVAMMGDWDYGAALDGNYFEDDPSAF